MKKNSDELPAFARIGFGLFSAVLGLYPMLAAFDVGPLSREDINGPPWLGFVAGSVFFLVGLLLLLGERVGQFKIGYVLVFLLAGAMIAVPNWIAFGPGSRACDDGSTGLMCRGPFGVFALMLDGVLVWMLTTGIARLLGPGKLASGVEAVGKGVLFLGLSPILVPLLLVLLVKVGYETVRERVRTGRWPRNQEFIERMKLKKRAQA